MIGKILHLERSKSPISDVKGDSLHQDASRSNTREQSTAADRHEDRLDWIRVLPHNFHPDGALSCNNVRVVVGVHINQPLLLHQHPGVSGCLVECVPVQNHPGAVGSHPVDLDTRGCLGHDDRGLHAHAARRVSEALGMVARRCRDHAGRSFGLTELAHLVVGTAQLEGEHRLEILALEEDAIAQPR